MQFIQILWIVSVTDAIETRDTYINLSSKLYEPYNFLLPEFGPSRPKWTRQAIGKLR